MKICREEFQTMVNGGWETGVCQLQLKHKGPHDCTVAAAPALPEPLCTCFQESWIEKGNLDCPFHYPAPQPKAALPEVAPTRPTNFEAQGLLETLYARKAEAYMNLLESQLAAAKGGWIDCKQELPPMTIACSWNDPHHKGGFTTSELVETWHPNASADRTTLQQQRKFQRRISYITKGADNWVHDDCTHWRHCVPPPTPPSTTGEV